MASSSGKATPSSIRYLSATLTQGSADAFKETEMATGLSSLANFAYRIREIVWEFSSTNGANGGANYELSLTHTTQAAIPTYLTRALIAKEKYMNQLVTSGAFTMPQIRRIQYTNEDNVLVVTESIFAQLDSAASSVANTVYCRVGYEVVTLSELERLNILNAVSLGF